MSSSIPKDTLAEILLYLVEKESFDSLKELGTVSRPKFVQAIKALAEQLKLDVIKEIEAEEIEKLQGELKKPFQEIVAQLPPDQRERLLKGFLN